MADKIIGLKIIDSIPKCFLDNLALSFEDYGMNIKDDLQYCEMNISDRGICWIHDVRDRTQFWKGKAIANFNIDGTRFWFTKAVHRNTERVVAYNKSRAEFFKVPRTAREVEIFEIENRK